MKAKLTNFRNLPFNKVTSFNFLKITLSIILLIPCFSLYSQEYLWHRQFSGGASIGREVVQDGSGNTYVVGNFQGVVNFGGSFPTTSASIFGDIFLAKYDANNNFLWVKQFGTVNASCMATGATLFKDASNNVFLYVSGYFSSANGSILTVDFNPPLPGGELTMNDTDGDAFVAKYLASSGANVWAHRVANSRANVSSGGKITTDGVGNAYVASYDGATGGFLKKFNSTNGNQLW